MVASHDAGTRSPARKPGSQKADTVRLPDRLPAREPANLDLLAAAAAEGTSPVHLDAWKAEERQLDRTTYLIAGMSVLFLFVLVRSGVTDLLDERREGTLPRLAIAAAKAATSVVLGLVSMTVLVAAFGDQRFRPDVGVAVPPR